MFRPDANLGHEEKRADFVAEFAETIPEVRLDFLQLRQALGERDQAFARLDAAFEENTGLGRMNYDPLLLPLYSDPRFTRLLRRMNLPGPCAGGMLQTS